MLIFQSPNEFFPNPQMMNPQLYKSPNVGVPKNRLKVYINWNFTNKKKVPLPPIHGITIDDVGAGNFRVTLTAHRDRVDEALHKRDFIAAAEWLWALLGVTLDEVAAKQGWNSHVGSRETIRNVVNRTKGTKNGLDEKASTKWFPSAATYVKCLLLFSHHRVLF
jgi:hypothetical protein